MNLAIYSIKKRIICLVVVLSMFSIFPQFVISKETLPIIKAEKSLNSHWEEHFKQTIQHWISQIGQKEPLFVDWSFAHWKSYPLGPGMRQWMILILNEQNQEIGYLVVGENLEEKLMLIEYGKSEGELISSHFLNKNISENNTSQSFLYQGVAMLINKQGTLSDAITRETYEHIQPSELKTDYFGEEVAELKEIQGITHDPAKASIAFYKQKKSKEEAATPIFLSPDNSYYYSAEIMAGVKGIYDVVSIHQWAMNHQTENTKTTSSTSYIGLCDQGIRYFSIRYLDTLKGDFVAKP